MERLVYISGKIAGLPEGRALELFGEAYMELLGMGYSSCEIFNPAAQGVVSNFEWADYIFKDLVYLRRCTAIYLLESWEDSPGAKVEKAFAEGLGLRIMYQSECRGKVGS